MIQLTLEKEDTDLMITQLTWRIKPVHKEGEPIFFILFLFPDYKNLSVPHTRQLFIQANIPKGTKKGLGVFSLTTSPSFQQISR